MNALQRRLDRLEATARPVARPAGICFRYPQIDVIHVQGCRGVGITLAEFIARYGMTPKQACGELWTIATDDPEGWPAAA